MEIEFEKPKLIACPEVQNSETREVDSGPPSDRV